LCFATTPSPIALLLPTNIATLENFKVAIVGAYTFTLFLATIEKYFVWNAILEAVLDLCKSSNPSYKHVEITTPPYAQQDSIIDHLNTNGMPNSFVEGTNSLNVFGNWHIDLVFEINVESNSLFILDLAP
jgi:hypothetical protein